MVHCMTELTTDGVLTTGPGSGDRRRAEFLEKALGAYMAYHAQSIVNVA